MNDLRLPALDGTHPLAFLAACGVLRVVTEELGHDEAALWFDGEGACLRSKLDQESLVGALADYLGRRGGAWELGAAGPNELPGFDDLKDELTFWQERFKALRATWLEGDETAGRALAFLAAMVTDLVTANDNVTSKPTAFYMTAGQQLFIRLVRELVAELVAAAAPGGTKKKPAPPRLPVDLSEALLGPWRYGDDTHPMGWDPWCERLYAYQAVSPSKDPRPKSTRAAVWLAFEGLPFFPVTPRPGDFKTTLATTGYSGRRDDVRFCWPVWTSPASCAEVRALVSCSDVVDAVVPRNPEHARHAKALLRARGVSVVCRSLRADLGTKGYAILRPPEVFVLGAQ